MFKINYYLKLKILKGYSSVNAEIREIEFFNNNNKIPINKLSVLSYSSQYNSTQWSANKAINGVSNSQQDGWCTANNQVLNEYIILKCTEKFNKILIYNDSQGSFAIKECEIYTCKSELVLTKLDVDNYSKLAHRFIEENNTQFPQGLSTIEIKFNIFLLKSEDKYYSIKDEDYDSNLNKYIPKIVNNIDTYTFDNYGMDDLLLVNSQILNDYINNNFNIVILK